MGHHRLIAQRLVPVTNLGLDDSRRHDDGMCYQVRSPQCDHRPGPPDVCLRRLRARQAR